MRRVSGQVTQLADSLGAGPLSHLSSEVPGTQDFCCPLVNLTLNDVVNQKLQRIIYFQYTILPKYATLNILS